jgi:hypothetical protein
MFVIRRRQESFFGVQKLGSGNDYGVNVFSGDQFFGALTEVGTIVGGKFGGAFAAGNGN